MEPFKEEKKKPVEYTLKKDFKTEKKMYKAGDKFSHSNDAVIAYLKTNQYI